MCFQLILMVLHKGHLVYSADEGTEAQRVMSHTSVDAVIHQTFLGFPGGAVVENLPANAGDTGSSPGLGKIPHATDQLSP